MNSAKGIGAVNTVVKTEDNRFVGYNTDGLGLLDPSVLLNLKVIYSCLGLVGLQEELHML